MRTIVLLLMALFCGLASAAPYSCPPPPNASSVNCTLTSEGGTTTFTLTVSAVAVGNHQANSYVSLRMAADGVPCNSNYDVHVPIDNASRVDGTCTIAVTSKKSVSFTADAPNHSATASSIALAANTGAFIADFLFDVVRAGFGAGTVTSSDGKIACGIDCSENYGTAPVLVTLVASANAGSAFGDWSGACSGTAASCTITMDASKTVVATFNPSSTPQASSSQLIVYTYDSLDRVIGVKYGAGATIASNYDAAGNWLSSAAAVGKLDVDASITASNYDALTDGLLIMRYMFGLTGAALTNGALGLTATRTDPTAIKAYLDSIGLSLDIDGNGKVDALTDGLLIIRYLFGLRGSALINGGLNPLGIRKTAAEIESYIQSLMQ